MNIKIDEVENSVEYLKIKDKLEQLIANEFGNKKYLGKCHDVWNFKKRLLKNKYNIDWKSPKELNPDVIFD